LRKRCEMNIEAKKLSFIQEFLNIDNEDTITALENLLHKSKSELLEEKMRSMTLEQLDGELDIALEDEKNNRITNAKDLKRKIQEWS